MSLERELFTDREPKMLRKKIVLMNGLPSGKNRGIGFCKKRGPLSAGLRGTTGSARPQPLMAAAWFIWLLFSVGFLGEFFSGI